MKNKKTTEQIIINAIITNTSNKENKFKTDRKTLYISVVDDISRKILLDNDFTEYTSKEDGEKFFIVKAGAKIDVWVDKEIVTTIDTTTNSDNFKTTKEIALALIKGYSEKNSKEYFRAFAIKTDDIKNIEIIEKQNPFI